MLHFTTSFHFILRSVTIGGVSILASIRRLFYPPPASPAIQYTPRLATTLNMAAQRAKTAGRPAPTVTEVALALLEHNKGTAAAVLKRINLDLKSVQPSVRSPLGPQSFDSLLPAAQEEQHHMGHTFLGTEHLLLALLRHGHNPLANALIAKGFTTESLRVEILKEIDPNFTPPPPNPPTAPPAAPN